MFDLDISINPTPPWVPTKFMLHNMPCGVYVCVCVPNNLVSWYYVTSVDCKPWKTRTLGFNTGLALNWQAAHNTSLTCFLSPQGSWDYDDTWLPAVACVRTHTEKQIQTQWCRVWFALKPPSLRDLSMNLLNGNQQCRSLLFLLFLTSLMRIFGIRRLFLRNHWCNMK